MPAFCVLDECWFFMRLEELQKMEMCFLKKTSWDFPGGIVVKILRSQCRGPGFDPWSEN